jgi:hypothetical protein
MYVSEPGAACNVASLVWNKYVYVYIYACMYVCMYVLYVERQLFLCKRIMSMVKELRALRFLQYLDWHCAMQYTRTRHECNKILVALNHACWLQYCCAKKKITDIHIHLDHGPNNNAGMRLPQGLEVQNAHPGHTFDAIMIIICGEFIAKICDLKPTQRENKLLVDHSV